MNSRSSASDRPRACCFPEFDNSPEAKRAKRRAEWLLSAILPGDWTIEFSSNGDTGTAALLDRARAADLILAWDQPRLLAAPLWLQRRAVLDDPLCDTGNPASVITNLARHLKLTSEVTDTSLVEFLTTRSKVAQRTVIVGSGPVPDKTQHLRNSDFVIAIGARGLTTACMLGHADLYIAWDAAAHWGPSETAKAHRERLIEQQRQSRLHLVYPAEFSPLVRKIWPSDLQARTFAVDASKQGMLLPDQILPLVATRNVLTAIAIPLASALPGTITTVGITKSASRGGADAHWEHEAESEYQRDIAAMLIEHPLFATRASRAYLDEHFTILAAQLAKLHESGKLAGTAPEIGKKPIEIDRIGRRSLAKRIVAWAVKQLDVAQVYPAASFSFTFAIAACIGLGATMLIDWDILLALLVGVNAAGFIALALFLRARIDRAVSQMKSETTAQATRAFANLSSRLDALENSTSSSTNS